MAYTTAAGGYGASASVFHFSAAHSDTIVIPDAELLFTGDFKRHGPDLILTGHNGRHHVVPGYFSSEKHPALVAPNGASLSAALVDLLAGSPTPGQFAQASPTPTDPIGKVEKVVGHVVVIRNGVAIALNVGDAVYKSDIIQTGANSSCGLDFPDGTALNLVANTRMALNDYSYDPNSNSNDALFSLVQGTFAFVAGKVAHTGDMKIETPVATMGIRGTTGFVQEQIGTISANIGNVTYSFAVVEDYGTGRVGQYELVDPQGNVVATVSQNGFLTYVTPQGTNLPPIVTTQPMSNTQLGFEQQIIQQVFQVLNSGTNPNPQSNPGNNGSSSPPSPLHNLPQLLQNNGNGTTFTVGGNGSGGQSSTSSTQSSNTTAATPTVTWVGSFGGDWNNPYNWSDGVVPLAWEVVDLGSKATLSGGAIVAGLVITSGGILNIVGGGDLTLSNSLEIAQGGALQLNSSSVDPTLAISGTVKLTGGGTIFLLGTGDNNIIAAGSGANLTNLENTIAGSGTIGAGDKTLTLVNGVDLANGTHGTIDATPLLPTDSGLLVIHTGNPVENSGVMEATGGGTLKIQDDVDNSGGVASFAGTVSSPIVSTVSFESVTVTNESGGVIGTHGTGASVTFTDGAVVNGGVIATNGGAVTFTDSAVTNNSLVDLASGSPGINADGAGTITFDGGSVTNNGLMAAQDGSQISFTGGEIDNTAGSVGMLLWPLVSTIIPAGIWAYDGGAITFSDTQVTNPGLITAAVGGTISEPGTGGTINFDNTIVDNSGGTIAAANFVLASTNVLINLSDSTIEGGTLETSGTGSSGTNINAVVSDSGPTDPNLSALDGTTEGALTVAGYVGIFQGAQLELKGTIHIDSANGEIDVGGPSGGATGPANLVIGGTVPLDTDGANTTSASISLDGTATHAAQIIAAAGGGSLDNVNTLIAGSGDIGAGNPDFLLTNEASGVINASGATALTVDNDSPATNNSALNEIINSGTIEANGSGGLTIENSTIDNSTYDPNANTGVDGHIVANSLIDLDNATILQGFVSISPNEKIETTVGSNNEIETANGSTHNTTVATIINDGTLAISNGSSLTLASPDAIDNAGTIELNAAGNAASDATTLFIDQGFAGINGHGQITLSDSTENFISVTAIGDQLTNFDNTISGAGTIGGGGMVLVNNGTIDATGTNPLIIDADGTPTAPTDASLTNTGTLEATGSATLVISSPTVDNTNGTISAVGAHSIVQLAGAAITAGTIDGAGTLEVKDSSSITGVSAGDFTVAAVTIDATQKLTLDGDSVTGTTFNDTASGAVLSVDANDTLTLTNVIIEGGAAVVNGVVVDGGALNLASGATLDLYNTQIVGVTLSDLGKINVFDNSTIDSFGSVLTGLTDIAGGKTLFLNNALVTGDINGADAITGLHPVAASLIDVTGSSEITGNATVTGGDMTVQSGVTLTLDNVTVSGVTITEINTSTSIIQVDNSDTLSVTAASEIDGGTINGGGSLTASGATLSFSGVTLDDVTLSDTASGSFVNLDTLTVGVDGVALAGATINNTATGASIDDTGTLSVTAASEIDGGTINGGGSLTASGATLSFSGVTLDDVTLSDTASGSFVNLDTLTVGVDGVALAGATINNTATGASIDDTGTLSVTAASEIDGGTINGGGSLTASGATLSFSGVTLDDVTLSDTASGSFVNLDTLTVGVDGVALAGATINNTATGASIDDTGTLSVTAASEIDGGTINGGGSLTASGATLSFSGVTLDDVTLSDTASGSFVNLDTLTVGVDGVALAGATINNTATGASIDDTGTLSVTAASEIDGGTINGGGSLTASGATLSFSGVTLDDVTLSDTASGSFVNLDTLTVGVDGVALAGATIAGGNIVDDGTISAAGTNEIDSAINGSGALTVTSGTLTLTNTNSYSGSTTINGGTLKLTGTGSIAASTDVIDDGTLDISGTTAGAAIVTLSGTGGVTLGGQTLTLSDASTTFSGAIDGSGGLTLTTGTETLTGDDGYSGSTTINGGTLKLTATGSIAASTDVIDDGTLDISATTNGASIITLSGSGGVTLGSQTLTLSDASTTFSGAVDGSGGLTLTTGTETLNGATITAGTLVDDGTIAVGSADSASTISVSTVTIAAGAFVDADGGTLTITETQPGSFNSGTIEALDGGTLTINHDNGSSSTNTGTIKADDATVNLNDNLGTSNSGSAEAVDGGTINLNLASSLGTGGGNSGTIEANDGTIVITGEFTGAGIDNVGGNIEALGTGIVQLLNAGIGGGRLTTDEPSSGAAGIIEIVSPSGGGSNVSVFDGATESGDPGPLDVNAYVKVQTGADLVLIGDIDNIGVIDVASAVAPANTLLVVDNTVALSGAGVVTLEGSDAAIVGSITGTANVLHNSSTIQGAGSVVGDLTLDNQTHGVVDATGTSPLVIDTGGHTITNAGTLEASDLSTLHIESAVTNSGTINVIDGGTVELDDVTVTNTTTIEVNAATGSGVSLSATYLEIAGTVTLQGGPGNATGAGTVTLTDSYNNFIDSNGSAAELINADNTISGAGTIGDANLTLNNEQYGIIDATGANPLILNTGTNTIINAGTLEATSGATLEIDSNVTNSGLIEVTAGSVVELASVTITDGTIKIGSATDTSDVLTVGNGNSTTLSDVTVTNDGSIKVDPNALGSILILDDGTTITGGALTIASSGQINVEGFASGTRATLSDVAVTNDDTIQGIVVASSATLVLDDGTTISGGALHVEAGSTLDVDSGSATLDGVTVHVDNPAGSIETDLGAVLTLTDDTTVTSGLLAVGSSAQPGGELDIEVGADGTASPAAVFSSVAVANNGTIEVGETTAAVFKIGADTGITGGALDIGSTGTLEVVAGTFDNGPAGATFDGVTVTDSGTLQVDSGLTLTSTGVTAIDGDGEIALDGTLAVTGGTLSIASTITLDNRGTLEATGGATLGIEGAVDNGGTIVADGGTADVAGAVTDTGSATISNSGVVEFQSTVASGQTITFDDSTGTLKLDDAADFHATISGFGTHGTGNTIDLTGITYSSSEYDVWTQSTTGQTAGGTLAIYSGNTLEASLKLSGTYTESDFALTSDRALTNPGTEIVWSPASGSVSGTNNAGNTVVGSEATASLGGETATSYTWLENGQIVLSGASDNSYTPTLSTEVGKTLDVVVGFAAGGVNEQITELAGTVVAASPTLATTPDSTAITLGTTAPTLSDSATLAGGYDETGNITFTLYYDGGTTPVDTETVSVSGNKTYSTPIGYPLPTNGTVTGTYQWDASYTGDGDNNPVSDIGNTGEQVTVSAASPTLVSTASSAVTLGTAAPTLNDSAVLAGGYNETGSITFTLTGPDGFSYTQTDTISGNSTYSASTTLPTTGTVAGTYTWEASYGGDGNNGTASDQGGAAEQTVVSAASPTLTATPNATAVTQGSTPTLTDTATLSGGFNETGTITITLVANEVTLYTDDVTVSGNGAYSTASGNNPGGYTLSSGAATGTYQWNVGFTGDGNNNVATDNNNANEQVTVYAAPTVTTPTISDETPGSSTVTQGDTLTASATGNGFADDHITYAWYSSVDGYHSAIGTGSTYVVQAGDIGDTIEVVGTSTNGAGATVTTTSAPTATVVAPIDDWTNAAGGDWSTGSDWDHQSPPAAAATANIDSAIVGATAPYFISIATDTSAGGLTLNDADATLGVGNGNTTDSFTLGESATLDNGKIDVISDTTMTVGGTFTVDGGSADVWAGSVAADTTNGVLTVDGAVVVDGGQIDIEAVNQGAGSGTAGTLNAASIEVDNGAVEDDGTINVTGAVNVDGGSFTLVAGGSLTAASFTVDGGAAQISGGELAITGPITLNGGSLLIGPNVFFDGTGEVTFGSNGGTLTYTGGSNGGGTPLLTVAGFGPGDIIELPNVAYMTGEPPFFNAGTLFFNNDQNSIAFAGSGYITADFSVISNGIELNNSSQDGTEIVWGIVPTMTVTPTGSPPYAPYNDYNNDAVTAQLVVKDGAGNPVEGATLQAALTLVSGSGGFGQFQKDYSEFLPFSYSPAGAATDNTGTAYVNFSTFGFAGTYQIAVTIDGVETLTQQFTVAPGPAWQSSSSLTSEVEFAAPQEIAVLTLSDVDITGSNPRSGDAVAWTGTGAFSPANGAGNDVTNVNGILVDTFTPASDTSQTVSANFDTADVGGGVTESSTVNFVTLDTWENAAGGTWNDTVNVATNWSTGSVPTSDDIGVWIGAAGTYTVHLTTPETIDGLGTIATATLDLAATLEINGQAMDVVAGPVDLESTGALVAQGGATVELNGSLNSSAGGNLTADGATIELNAGLSGTLAITIEGAGIAQVAEALGGGDTVTFAGAGTLTLGAAPSSGVIVNDFGVGDTIDLASLAYSPSAALSWNSTTDTLTVSNGSANESLGFELPNGLSDVTHFALRADGSGGTDIVYNTPSLTTLATVSGTDSGAVSAGLVTDARGDLLGTTAEGGANDSGTVFEIKNDGGVSDPSYASSPTILINFNSGTGGTGGFFPVDALMVDGNGNLFGTAEGNSTSFLASDFSGTVFEIVNNGSSASSPVYASSTTTLIAFSPTDNSSQGGGPEGNLIEDAHGDLFGTTSYGGQSGGFGTVFELVYSGGNYSLTTLASFNGAGGYNNPESGLLMDSNGDLFGTTSGLGSNGPVAGFYGYMFELANTGNASSPSYSNGVTASLAFDGWDGANPVGGLVEDAKGDLFGTTAYGGANNNGTIFEIVNNGNVATPSYSSIGDLFSFSSDGPHAGLIIDGNGDLFGITSAGEVFELANTGTVAAPSYASNLISLGTPGTVNAGDYAPLYADGNGNLFGIATDPNNSADGVVFEITNSGYVVHDPATIAAGGSFEIAAASDDGIAFAGNTGLLQLDQSQGFVGTVANFSGQDQIDLRDIGFGANTTLSYGGNSGNTLGVLTVTDGTHTANIELLGQYVTGNFTMASDGHGGTMIVDPPVSYTVANSASQDVAGQSSANVTFAGSTGSLMLDNPASFTGTIDGFTGTAPNAQHSDVIDLAGVNFNSASFSESYNTSTGVLTVSDGTNSASLTFDDFNGTFKFASDGAGGTDIYDPPASHSTSAVSVGQDSFVFHPNLGAESGNAATSDSGTAHDHAGSAHNAEWSALIAATQEAGTVDVTPPAESHWHHALHNATHLH